MSFNGDVLTIGGIAFDDFSTPDKLPYGGKQAMVIHKLPGGARVIDTLGPDEDDISLTGHFFGDNAYNNAVALDAIRASGQVVTFSGAGQSRQVIVSHFTYNIRRLPVWVEYSITCTVAVNPSLGNLTSTNNTIDNLILGDIAFAVSLL
jgi:hypothetical protein